MDDPSTYLIEKARRLSRAYRPVPGLRAFMVTGSAAEGLSDNYSDIDMTAYYDELPPEEALRAAREQNGGGERLWLLGDRDTGSFAEAYRVDGIECQIGHTTIVAWEQSMAKVLVDHDVASPSQKALYGTLHCRPLYGDRLIHGWQAQIADYPPALAEAMVNHYLRFFPLWGLQPRLEVRDSVLWQYQILVESAQNILGVLAGLNHQYYSTFQFKRMRQFVDSLTMAPADLAERLESLFDGNRAAAAVRLESLVAELLALVEEHMPQVDTAVVKRRPGWRQEPWAA